jgi:hypothetical protein
MRTFAISREIGTRRRSSRLGRDELAAIERAPGLEVDAHLEVGLTGASGTPDEDAAQASSYLRSSCT